MTAHNPHYIAATVRKLALPSHYKLELQVLQATTAVRESGNHAQPCIKVAASDLTLDRSGEQICFVPSTLANLTC